MTRVVVVADRGEDFASLTAAVGPLPGACLVRHGSGAAPLDRMVGAIAPDLVVIGALRTGRPVRGPARRGPPRGARRTGRGPQLGTRRPAHSPARCAPRPPAHEAPAVMPSPTKEGPACVR